MDARSALPASRDDRLWRRDERTLPMKAPSHGRVIGPAPGSPYTSADILRSSLKISLLRYTSGTSKQYTTKKPFLGGDAAVQASESSPTAAPSVRKSILFLPAAAALSHFLAIWASLLELIIVSGM
ncbi:hypothetical protein Taro_049395 [Colocasia esculenta]|uniref:Uncharacterized protein n=1 Tax=Colocasia esculenta TaxID=4460 RepID=A0A843XAY2_COLES|nr:hypothetical protein [Colocasia esculenta]